MNKQPTREVFKDRLREITDFALRHAQNNLPPLGPHSSEEDIQAYIKKVWEGWKWAQACITEDLVYIHISRIALQRLGKEARKNRDKSRANPLATAIKNLNHQEAILKMVANSMVWTMFRMERWKVRWLWTAGPSHQESARKRYNLYRSPTAGPRVPITSIGPQTSAFVDDINGSHDSVALMTDITSLVGVGDVLVVDWDHGGRPVIVELKSGATNSRIVSLVEAHQADIEKVPPHELEEIGPQARKHFERVARQTEREQNFESIVNNDTGKDPETGAYFQNIGTEAMDLDIYDPALDAMMSAAAKAGSVIECIDGCLWMGVYYRASLQDEPWQNFLQEITNRGASGSFRVWNVQQASMHPRMQPIFLRAMSPESVHDILLGDALVLAYIDWDAFFQQANDKGINARWTTRGERKGITETLGRQDQAFRHDGRTPVFGLGEEEYCPLGGTAQRIVVEGTSPRSSLQMIEDALRRWNESEDGPGVDLRP